ncbi:MAG TPA: hypothetical protein VEK14_03900 [Rhodomicrobium sp.]|nr:hypothetical protein [Rhodomicrobium sp.]
MSPSRRRILENVFRSAHATARAVAAKEGVSYREALSAALVEAHRAAAARRAKREADAASFLDWALGLPVRSCEADASARDTTSHAAPKPASFFAGKPNCFTGVRAARRLFTTSSGRLAGSFAA